MRLQIFSLQALVHRRCPLLAIEISDAIILSEVDFSVSR